MDTREEDFFRLIRRGRSGFQSFCAMIDLLGPARRGSASRIDTRPPLD